MVRWSMKSKTQESWGVVSSAVVQTSFHAPAIAAGWQAHTAHQKPWRAGGDAALLT